MVKLKKPTKPKAADADTPEFYETALHIDDTKLDQMCREQPEALYRVARSLVYAKSRRDEAKQALKEEEAKADARARHRLEVDQEKVTEAAVNASRVLDKDVLKARDLVLDLEKEAGEWEALKDAFMDRSYMLRECMKYFLAQHFNTTGTLNEIRDSVQGATKPQQRNRR